MSTKDFRHKLCNDPRDKIYGLLALLDQSPSLDIRPDYSTSAGDLYQQVTQIIISQSGGDLRYLTGSGLGSDCYQLPSWVRNFAAPLHPVRASNERSRFSKYNLYCASGQTKSEAKMFDKDTPGLSGVFIDHVDRIGSLIECRDWNHPQGVLPGIKVWADMVGFSTLDRDCALGSKQERFWRTITADAFVADNGNYERIPPSPHPPLSSWFTTIEDTIAQGREPLITPYVFAFWSAVSDRTLFRTRKGYMGL